MHFTSKLRIFLKDEDIFAGTYNLKRLFEGYNMVLRSRLEFMFRIGLCLEFGG